MIGKRSTVALNINSNMADDQTAYQREIIDFLIDCSNSFIVTGDSIARLHRGLNIFDSDGSHHIVIYHDSKCSFQTGQDANMGLNLSHCPESGKLIRTSNDGSQQLEIQVAPTSTFYPTSVVRSICLIIGRFCCLLSDHDSWKRPFFYRFDADVACTLADAGMDVAVPCTEEEWLDIADDDLDQCSLQARDDSLIELRLMSCQDHVEDTHSPFFRSMLSFLSAWQLLGPRLGEMTSFEMPSCEGDVRLLTVEVIENGRSRYLTFSVPVSLCWKYRHSYQSGSMYDASPAEDAVGKHW